MATRLIEDDPELALEHARAARHRAGRIAVVRETAGVIAYHAGEWAEALSELRTARRMSGGSGLLAVMADCERGLGRPERAIELGRSDEARQLSGDEATELRIVVAGARMDLGQYDQAVVTLQTAELDPARIGPSSARLFYAYAEALLAAARSDEALTWFLNAASADAEGDTDAEERADELAAAARGEVRPNAESATSAAEYDDDPSDDDLADDEATDGEALEHEGAEHEGAEHVDPDSKATEDKSLGGKAADHNAADDDDEADPIQ